MGTSTPFRFGVTATTNPSSAAAWHALARRVEDDGYSTLLVSDHLGDQLAPMPALAAAATATATLRVGALVAANDFRHPVVHAKEIATIDVLSDGRVEWGMGAGWLKPEFEAAGIPFRSRGERVERLVEAITVMRGCFADEPVTFESVHYEVRNLDARPKPVQRPHPPLLVGGAERRMLSFAGGTADIVSVNPSVRARPFLGRPPQETVEESIDRQIGWIREGAGPRFDQLEVSMVAFATIVANDRSGRATELAALLGLSEEEALRSPHALLGSTDDLCDQIEDRRARWGISYWVVPEHTATDFAPVVARLAGR